MLMQCRWPPPQKHVFGARALEIAMTGGEDYELLFTANSAVMKKVQKAASARLL